MMVVMLNVHQNNRQLPHMMIVDDDNRARNELVAAQPCWFEQRFPRQIANGF